MHPYVAEWLAIENGWPRRFLQWDDAPAEMAEAVTYLLNTAQAQKAGQDVFDRVRAREAEYQASLTRAMYGK